MSHFKGESAGPGWHSQDHPYHEQAPASQTSMSLAGLQQPLAGMWVTGLNIIISLLMGNLRAQAHWTAIYHFPFDSDIVFLSFPNMARPGPSWLAKAYRDVLHLPIAKVE